MSLSKLISFIIFCFLWRTLTGVLILFKRKQNKIPSILQLLYGTIRPLYKIRCIWDLSDLVLPILKHFAIVSSQELFYCYLSLLISYSQLCLKRLKQYENRRMIWHCQKYEALPEVLSCSLPTVVHQLSRRYKKKTGNTIFFFLLYFQLLFNTIENSEFFIFCPKCQRRKLTEEDVSEFLDELEKINAERDREQHSRS